MVDPIQAFMQASGLGAQTFAPNSRYSGTATAQMTLPDGTPVAYLRRRFVPQPDSLALVQEHPVIRGDRLDNLAAQYLGDPELYWQICDANGAIRPAELTETVGRRLRITLPQGVPGLSGA
jgi:hypothetical protein